MTAMLEKVASAIVDALDNEDGRVDCTDIARAALEAMREPTPDMAEHPSYEDGKWSLPNIQAFVDAALGKDPPA